MNKELKIETSTFTVKVKDYSQAGGQPAYVAKVRYAVTITKPNGKSPYANYAFRTEKARQEYIEQEQASFQRHLTLVKERQEKRKQSKLNLKIGDILYTSWGYDQTNVDWYQVTDLFGNSGVILREIGASVTETGFMSGESLPIRNDFISEPMRKIVRGDYITIDESRTAFLWNGKPKYNSWYA
jgi:hypothetical protein